MELVRLMGGRAYSDLNVSVTHLIAEEVGSKKYLVAASLSKPILLPAWIKACWEKSQDRYLHYRLYGVNLNSHFKTKCASVHVFQPLQIHRPALGGLCLSGAAWLQCLCDRFVQYRAQRSTEAL